MVDQIERERERERKDNGYEREQRGERHLR